MSNKIIFIRLTSSEVIVTLTEHYLKNYVPTTVLSMSRPFEFAASIMNELKGTVEFFFK